MSDGEETCRADPCAVGRELKAQGVNFTAHVIGFDVARGSRAQQRLQCLADATGGRYLDARSAGEPNEALGTLGRLASDACAGFGAAQAFMPGTTLSSDGDAQAASDATSFEVLRLPDAAGPRECQAPCLEDAGCMAWQFEATGFLFVDHPRCFRYGRSASLLREDRAADPKEVVSGVREGSRVVKAQAGFAHCVAAGTDVPKTR